VEAQKYVQTGESQKRKKCTGEKGWKGNRTSEKKYSTLENTGRVKLNGGGNSEKARQVVKWLPNYERRIWGGGGRGKNGNGGGGFAIRLSKTSKKEGKRESILIRKSGVPGERCSH